MCESIFVTLLFLWSLWRAALYFFLTGVTEPQIVDASTISPLTQAAHFINLQWSYFAPLALIAKLLTLLRVPWEPSREE